MYNREERLFLVECYKEFSLQKVCDLFHASFPGSKRPGAATVLAIVNKFKETGHVEPNLWRNRPRHVLTEQKQQELLEIIETHKDLPMRAIAKMVGISSSTVFQYFKMQNHKFERKKNAERLKTSTVFIKMENDNKMEPPTDLCPKEQEQRNTFCEIMFDKFNKDRLLLHKILFNNIATFYIKENVDFREIEYSNNSNTKYFYSAPHNTATIKVNVWMGLIGFNIIGPFFIDGNINSKTYLQLLQHSVLPALKELNFNHKENWFQHTGLDAKTIRLLLDMSFPNRWIGRGGVVGWPENSDDLDPIVYFYWKYIKLNMIDLEEITDSEYLKKRIVSISETIKPLHVYNVIDEFYDRINYSLIVNGGRFEHKL